MPKKKKQRKPAKKPKKKDAFSDRELAKIKKELEDTRSRSVLIEEDIRRLKQSLNIELPPHVLPNKDTKVFYKDFVFECGNCVKEFRHRTEVSSIYHKVVCPKCNEEHVLVFKPNIKDYEVRLPKTIRQLRK